MTRLILTMLAAASCAAHALPEGFDIHPFATPMDMDYPTAITVSPEGDVYVSSDQNGSLDKNPGMGRVIRCRDTDGDGVADGLLEIRNIAGQASQLKRAEVAREQALPQSMMPPGLASGLSLEQFNSLIDYLASLRSKE